MVKSFFSPSVWRRRFGCALQGILLFFRLEHNAWVHLSATIVLLILAMIKGVSKTDALVLIIVTSAVWVAELLNTAIEKVADLVCAEYHPQVKAIKDMSAGAVLITAITAIITGLIIFIPKFL